MISDHLDQAAAYFQALPSLKSSAKPFVITYQPLSSQEKSSRTGPPIRVGRPRGLTAALSAQSTSD
jgi:hypothetical protein